MYTGTVVPGCAIILAPLADDTCFCAIPCCLFCSCAESMVLHDTIVTTYNGPTESGGRQLASRKCTSVCRQLCVRMRALAAVRALHPSHLARQHPKLILDSGASLLPGCRRTTSCPTVHLTHPSALHRRCQLLVVGRLQAL